MKWFEALRLPALAAAICMAAACGGNAGHLTPPAPQQLAPSGTKQQATLSISIPKKNASAAKRGVRYISPATTQMTVNVQTGCPGVCTSVDGYPTTVGLTTTSTGCTSTLASTQCTLNIALPAGSYTGTFTTLDASSAPLSTAQSVAFTIVAGTANRIAITLSGVPASVVATQISTNTFLTTALDADNNAIVGPGAPTFTVSSPSGIPITITQPTATSPNVFSVKATSAGTAILRVTASYSGQSTDACAQSGAVCTLSSTLTSALQSELAAASFGDNAVYVYDPPYTTAAHTVRVSEPWSVAFDSLGDLFVSAYSANCVYEYAPPNFSTMINQICGFSNDDGIAIDSNDRLFVADAYPSAVQVLEPPYTSGTSMTITNGISGPVAIALDASNNLLIGSTVASENIAPGYSPFAQQVDPGAPIQGIAADGNGGALISTPNTVVRSSPFGQAVTTVISGLESTEGIALDPSGNVYVADFQGQINEYSPTYSTISAPKISINNPIGIAFSKTYVTTLSP